MIRDTIFFDLDGTLLPLDMDAYVSRFMELIEGLDFGEELSKAFDRDTMRNAFYFMMSPKHPKRTNEEAFFDSVENQTKIKRTDIEPYFEKFYEDHFHKLKFATKREPIAREIIDVLKGKNYKLVLATNPLFPKIATQMRLGWAGLAEDDFIYISTFDNSRFSKPHLNYYNEILEKLSLDPKQCFMVGNNVEEDLCTKELGFEVFLLTEYIIGDIGKAPECEKGSYSDLLSWAESLPAI